jgi:hypothetical protein
LESAHCSAQIVAETELVRPWPRHGLSVYNSRGGSPEGACRQWRFYGRAIRLFREADR